MIDMNVGDVVTVQTRAYDRAGTSYRTVTITDRMNASGELRISRVYRDTLLVRGPILSGGRYASFTMYKTQLNSVNGLDPDTGAAPIVPRALGEKPEDTPEMTYIGLDHPGIQWLFQDMGKFADNVGWCETYDNLAEEFGIPAREEEFQVSVTHNGVVVSATIKARDSEAAEEILLGMFA